MNNENQEGEKKYWDEHLESFKRFISDNDYEHLKDLIDQGMYAEYNDLVLQALSRKNNNKITLINDRHESTSPSSRNIEALLERTNVLSNKIKNEQQLVSDLLKEKERFSNELSESKKTSNAQKEEIKKLNFEITNLQNQIQQKRIDEKIPEYVDNVKSDLSSDDNHFIFMSRLWAVAGVFLGILAVLASFYSLYVKIDFTTTKWFELLYIFTRGLIGISILSWLSYTCLSYAKKYTHESIRRKDRRHALMFGQVFLQIYGSTATKEDALSVFKDWNISGDSAFSDNTPQPPNVYTLFDNLKDELKSSIDDVKSSINERNE